MAVVCYKKRLCMAMLQIQLSEFCTRHFYDGGSGKVNSSFGYIEHGEVTLFAGRLRVTVHEGGFFYIPEGIRYHSVWTGNPDIRFYSIHIVSNRPDSTNAHRYMMSDIPEMSTPETGARVREIYRLFKTNDRLSQIRALGLYYLLYADTLPFLTPDTSAKRNPALSAAIEYTEKNYGRDFDVRDLAEYCHISESRLHHLFRSELATTPIKFRNELRIEKAAEEIRQSNDPVDMIAERCGFNSTTYFREAFRETTGMTPAEYRAVAGKQ